MDLLSWNEMKQKFKNEWIAITDWEEDECGEVVKGCVVHHATGQNAFYDYVNTRFAGKDLAVRYTGPVEGPFFFYPK